MMRLRHSRFVIDSSFVIRRPSFRANAAALLCLLGATGCVPNELTVCRQENVALRETLQARDTELIARQERIDALTTRVDTLTRVGTVRAEKLIAPVRLQFAPLTGGHDYDEKPGDDGITVYLQPVDADGHVIKAAGTITVQLFDLAAPEGQQKLLEKHLDADAARQAWYGRLLTRHFTVPCPWADGRVPTHREITVRATFTDFLTGTPLTCQDVFTIEFPPEPVGRPPTARTPGVNNANRGK